MRCAANNGMSTISAVAERPVFHKALGKRLRDLRTEKGWSVQGACNIANGAGPERLSWNQLTWLEASKVQAPSPDALRAVCELYELSYNELAREIGTALVSVYYLQVSPRDLTGHASTGTSTFPKGATVADLAAASRQVEQLRTQLARYKALHTQARRAASALATGLAAITENAKVGSPKRRLR